MTVMDLVFRYLRRFFGVWNYQHGTGGTLDLSSDGPNYVHSIAVESIDEAGTVQINSDDVINLDADGSLVLNPQGMLRNPTIAFSSAVRWTVEWIDAS